MANPEAARLAQRKKNQGRILSVVSALVGVSLLGYFLYRSDLHALWEAIKKTSPWAVAGVAAATISANILQGLRFYCLKPEGLSPARHAGLMFGLHTGNILLPMRAGEIIRPFYIKRWRPKASLKELVQWTIYDKLLEAATVVPYAIPGALALLPNLSFQRLRPLQNSLFVLALALLGYVVFRLNAKSSIVRAYPIGIAMWFCNFFVIFSVFPHTNIALKLFVATTFAAAIPALPGGLGAFEAAFVWVGNHEHLGFEHSFAMALVAHSTQILATLAVGVPLLSIWGWPQNTEEMEEIKQVQETQKKEMEST